MTLVKYPYVIVFIPAYNEEKSLANIMKQIKEIYTSAEEKGYWVDVIVVDDGSTDNTVKEAMQAGAKAVISHPMNRGLGAATRTGMQRAYEMGADIAVKIDADFQHDPADLDKVIRPIIEDKADCVFGSRFLGGLKYKMPLHRALGNKFFSWITSKLTGLRVTDGQTGLMAFSKRYLRRFEIIADYNETQQLIMDSYSRHMRVIEVSVLFHKRETGKSFISWRYPFKVLPTIIRLFVHISPLKVFLPIGLIAIFSGVTLAICIFYKGVVFFGVTTVAILAIGGIQTILFGLLADLGSKKR